MTDNLARKKPHHPHDGFFKMTMEFTEIAEDFLRENLPEDIQKLIDFSSLKIENNSFADNMLGKGHVDVLFSAKFDDQVGYISIFLEHQSTPDKYMAYRLQRYAHMIWRAYLDKDNDSDHLPIIIPIIFYTGQKNYNVPKSFFDLFSKPDLVKRFLFSENHVIDISHTPDAELVKKGKLSAIYFIFKHIKDKDLLRKLRAIKQELRELSSKYYLYFKKFFSYTIENTDDPDYTGMVKLFVECTTSEEQKGEIMNIAQRIENAGEAKGLEKGIMIGREEGMEKGMERGREEGMEKGMEKGMFLSKLEIARALLSTGQSIEYIAKVTGLSVEQVKGLLL